MKTGRRGMAAGPGGKPRRKTAKAVLSPGRPADGDAARPGREPVEGDISPDNPADGDAARPGRKTVDAAVFPDQPACGDATGPGRESTAGTAARAREILAVLARTYPKSKTALNFASPFQLLVAAMLSAQSTDRQVNIITAGLFLRYRTPADFARLTPAELAEEIKGCGLYRNKSKNIIATSRTLVEKYGSIVPSTREELEQLPGVGRKTANVVLNVAFGQPALPVDTHVFRVSHRLGLSGARTPERTEADLLKLIPEALRRDAHHQLITHGRQICRARRPRCPVCPLAGLCPSRDTAAAG